MDRYDVVIIGGGPAGLSAGLMLGRARRRVLLLDGNEPRNAASHASHSFFTRDGEPPMELRRIGREQLAPYTTVRTEDREAVSAWGENGAFQVTFADGGEVRARKLILATGVRDILPGIEGFQRLWGRSIFHCPYCDGWEVRDGAWAALAAPDELPAYAEMLSNWTRDLVMLTGGAGNVDPEAARRLAAMGIPIRTEAIARLEGDGDQLRRVVFTSGETLERTALFARPRQEPRTALAEQLGCELVLDGPIPGLVRVDAIQKTTTPGVFAVGDLTTPMQQIAIAVSTGATAGAMINNDLVHEDVDALVEAVH